MQTEPTTSQRDVTTQRLAQKDYILLDASGSMAGKRHDSYSAIDNYVAQLRDNATPSDLTIASFTSDYSSNIQYRHLRSNMTPESWTDMANDSELPNDAGGTPLYDAINVMMRELRNTMPVKCSILIITDGEENTSKTTVEQAKSLLDWGRAQGWQITFLGCDFENSRQAKLLGANESNTVGVSIKRLVDATSLIAEKRARYGLYGSDMNLTDDEKKDVGQITDQSAK